MSANADNGSISAVDIHADIVAASVDAFHPVGRPRAADVVDLAEAFATGDTDRFALADLAAGHVAAHIAVTLSAFVFVWIDDPNAIGTDHDTLRLSRERGSADDAGDVGRGTDGGTGASAPRTRTSVVRVEGEERVTELARMLSGHDDSEAALRHAAELLEEARVAESQA